MGDEVTAVPRPVPARLRPWSVPFPGYRPVDVTPPELRSAERAAAEHWVIDTVTDPAEVPDLAERRATALIPFEIDADGRPLNPTGRTGRIGRDLRSWGENAAADPIVIAGTGTNRHVLLIRRKDCGQWAIPGGHVDPGETAPAALVRELYEETGVDLSQITPTILARTHVADPRETDWAWIATTAALYELPEQVTATAGDDAADARWFPFDDPRTLTRVLAENGDVLYSAHDPLLLAAYNRLWCAAHVLDGAE